MVQVSIIIVNYNAAKMTDDCLRSIKEFTKDVSYEIIVFDNNSAEPIDTLTAAHPDVFFIKSPANLGFAKANNQAIRHATGEYMLILNNDTLFIENTMKTMIEVINTYQSPVFLGCKLLNSDGSLQTSYCMFPTLSNSISANLFLYRLFPKSRLFNKYWLNYLPMNKPTDVDFVIGAFIFCRSEHILALNGFDERFFFYADEMDLCRRFQQSGGRVIYYPYTSIYHLGGGTTRKMPWFKYKNQNISYIKIYQKYFKGIDFPVIIAFHYLGLLLRIPLFFLGGVFTLNKELIMRSFFTLLLLFVYPRNEFIEKQS